jgi:hypothetical protein
MNENTKIDKTMTSIFERMDDKFKSYRVLQEQVGMILEPQQRFQEQMNKYLEPQLRIQEQMNRYFEPHRKLQEQIQKYLEPQRLLQEKMNKYLGPHQRLQEQLEKYLEPQRQLQAQMGKYIEPHLRIQEQLSKYLEPQLRLQGQIDKYLQPLNRYLSDSLMDSIIFDKNGSLLVAGELVDVDDINNTVVDLSENYPSHEEFLGNLFRWLENLGSSARVAVIYLILPYFLSIVANLTTPIYEEWWKDYVDSDHRVAKKEIIREAKEIYTQKDLKEYRFVYASILHVRKTGNMSAEIIDELYLGKTLRIINKSKRWSYIEYRDSESGDIKQGWVLSRYVEKFHK